YHQAYNLSSVACQDIAARYTYIFQRSRSARVACFSLLGALHLASPSLYGRPPHLPDLLADGPHDALPHPPAPLTLRLPAQAVQCIAPAVLPYADLSYQSFESNLSHRRTIPHELLA